MADCINDDNEIELEVSTTYYSEKDPLFKQAKDGQPVNGMSLSYGDLNSTDEIKGVSEIKKCKPLELASSLTPAAQPVKCDANSVPEESLFSWLINTMLSLFRGEQTSQGDTIAKSIIVSITGLFIMFLIYKFELYQLSNLKSLFFTLFFLFKKFWVFTLLLFFMSLTYNSIFSYIPYFSDQALKYLYLSINPLSDEGVNNTYDYLSGWIIIPHVYLVVVISFYIFVTVLIVAFIILILFPLIIILGYFVGLFLSFMD